MVKKSKTAVKDIKVTEEIALEHGLNKEEYSKILLILGRVPNLTELGIFSAMWNEHCSYKSTRIHLKKFPTKASWVICGPGENAGIIDIGDKQALVFKMESHNHPSFIEPFQGAATGVGGILRDIFTMGARPVALLNSLRFGDIDHPKTSHLLSGVVSGISAYGNSIGVPNVGGECNFHSSYNNNNLVNAMCIGLVDIDKIFYSSSDNMIGCSVVYAGSKTGRDGIHGASMASSEFNEDSGSKRPSVQVADPFTGKCLMESCLELMSTDSVLAIQDMGAAGLTCSSIEMADKSSAGIEIDLDLVPVREDGMNPYEIMLSESQERMLMVLKPGKEDVAKRIFDKWGIDSSVIGKITDSSHLVLKLHDNIVANLSIPPLSNEAPVYDRKFKLPAKQKDITISDLKYSSEDPNTILKKLLSSPDIMDKSKIYSQYDSHVMGDTISGPGLGAAVIRIHNSKKALVATSDCTPRYCKVDPVMGGKQVVAESWRNIISRGANPLAITNCLNFGNPEKLEIMGQVVGCIEGISEACKFLDYPVVSGNVSLYNETNSSPINPTPTIGGVGMIDDYKKVASSKFLKEGQKIYVVGETKGNLGCSLYLREIEGREDGAVPEVDLGLEKKNGNFIKDMINLGIVKICNDVSDGGIYVTLAKMAIYSSMGVSIDFKSNLDDMSYLFSEDQARYLVVVDENKEKFLMTEAEKCSIIVTMLGCTVSSGIYFKGKYISFESLCN